MTYSRFCGRCYVTETTTHWYKANGRLGKDRMEAYLCNRCYFYYYNKEHREDKNTKARMRARLITTGTRTKRKKKQTQQQIQVINRQLKYQLKKMELKAEVIKWLYSPIVPAIHNNIWSSYPGVS